MGGGEGGGPKQRLPHCSYIIALPPDRHHQQHHLPHHPQPSYFLGILTPYMGYLCVLRKKS